MTALLVIVAVVSLAVGWALKAWAQRRNQARANAVLERLFAARMAPMPMSYATHGSGGRRVLS